MIDRDFGNTSAGFLYSLRGEILVSTGNQVQSEGWPGTSKRGCVKAFIYLMGTLILLGGVIYGLMIIGTPMPVLIVVGLVIGGAGLMGMAKAAGSSKKITQTSADSSGNSNTTETTVDSDAI